MIVEPCDGMSPSNRQHHLTNYYLQKRALQLLSLFYGQKHDARTIPFSNMTAAAKWVLFFYMSYQCLLLAA